MFGPFKKKNPVVDLVKTALGVIDSLNVDYRDEIEANRELYVSLRTANPLLDMELEPKTSRHSLGDLRIGNTIVEGKLGLIGKTKSDRLVGQIQYCHNNTRYDVIVVVYGYLNPSIAKRLKSEYPKRFTLVNLDHPKRFRRDKDITEN